MRQQILRSIPRGHQKACGKCPSCVERLAAFKLNNVSAPLVYESGE